LALVLVLPAACRTPTEGSADSYSGPINTDRPGFLFSSWLVPRGSFQVEAGVPLVALDDSSAGDNDLVSTPVQLRYGLSPSLELRVGSPVYNWLETDAGPDVDGFGDLEVGLKAPLPLPFNQDASALVAGLRLPTGDDAFQTDDPAPSLNAVSSWMLDEVTELKGLAGLAYLPVDGGEDPIFGSLAGLVSRALGSGWTGAVETIWFPTWNAADTAYAGAWAAKVLGDSMQLDASLHRGLTDDSSDWLVGIGISVRF
jgi:hypothetical protein